MATGKAREKVTVTLDREKVDAVREMVGARSTSAAIDVALSELLRHEHLRRDVAAYAEAPPSDSEIALARYADWSGSHDDTDWEALYADGDA